MFFVHLKSSSLLGEASFWDSHGSKKKTVMGFRKVLFLAVFGVLAVFF